MAFRRYKGKVLSNGKIVGVPYISNDIKHQIIAALANESLNLPCVFEIIFHDELYGILKGLITWRKEYKCIVTRYYVLLLKKRFLPEFVF